MIIIRIKYALLNALFDEVREQLTRITEAYFSEEGGTSYRLELANEILTYVLENARLFRLLLSGAVSLQRVGQLLDETLIPPCMAYLKQHPNKYGLDDSLRLPDLLQHHLHLPAVDRQPPEPGRPVKDPGALRPGGTDF